MPAMFSLPEPTREQERALDALALDHGRVECDPPASPGGPVWFFLPPADEWDYPEGEGAVLADGTIDWHYRDGAA